MHLVQTSVANCLIFEHLVPHADVELDVVDAGFPRNVTVELLLPGRIQGLLLHSCLEVPEHVRCHDFNLDERI